jgi:hypothetical protein
MFSHITIEGGSLEKVKAVAQENGYELVHFSGWSEEELLTADQTTHSIFLQNFLQATDLKYACEKLGIKIFLTSLKFRL